MKTLKKHQPCGCVVCTCPDPDRCHGCGAKCCGTHPAGQIPSPVYDIDTSQPVNDPECLLNLRNRIGGLTVQNSGTHTEDNIAIALVTYFEEHPDCDPNGPECDQTGWKQWSLDRTNELIDRVVKVLVAEEWEYECRFQTFGGTRSIEGTVSIRPTGDENEDERQAIEAAEEDIAQNHGRNGTTIAMNNRINVWRKDQ